MKIITLTLNPAFDVHCYAEGFAPYRENLARVTAYDAGGKGVNISRALTANGIANTAVVVLGSENRDGFERQLRADGISYRAVAVEGRIRENITIHTDGADETRISFEGFRGDGALLDRVLGALDGEALDEAYVTLTGRVPAGIGMEDIKSFVRELELRGAKIVIDSKSFSLDDLIEVSPYLIKPNQEEISEYLGREISSLDEAETAAHELRKKGIENVMISLGKQGALLISSTGAYVARPPKIDARSTIGAGDSSVAGFLAAAAVGKDDGERLRLAVSYGTAACLTDGTRPPLPKDVEDVWTRVSVESFE